MEHFLVMLVPLLAGFMLLGIGFNNREHEWGVRLIGAGALLMLAPIAVKLYLTLHLT
ncbi:hypothetical protein [Zestomonas carbonaria]|uniref:Uncharacterized protein n=1 Tax=Zestomonas carbonaria TaxID=2762745 RepID=A0A7U7ENW9_9GAMM|nr:hypothetical protein [Pseudomonas carbonaria]CAD5108494.1 hypothetical protein PSEWESI4_02781 [Pseudomonas carbonaria]